jgi:DNA polymerase III delta prime subunit
MCNYISRIDEGLQNDFIKIRFNSLPLSNTFSFLKEICINEKVDIEDVDLYKVIKFFKNDMRSMINFLQCNQHCQGEIMKKSIVCDEDFEIFLKVLTSSQNDIDVVCECLYQITISKNISHKQFFLSFLHYCFQQNMEIMFAKETLNGIEDLLHNSYCETKYFIPLALKKLQEWLKEK